MRFLFLGFRFFGVSDFSGDPDFRFFEALFLFGDISVSCRFLFLVFFGVSPRGTNCSCATNVFLN